MGHEVTPALDDPRILVGDCLDRMRDLTDNSIDAIVTDPPSGTGYGDHDWDTFGPEEQGSATPQALGMFRAFLTDVFKEASRILKPGGFAVVWAMPRSSHHTATALEDAGLPVRDVITHHYSTGTPKSRCPGEWIDRSPNADPKEWGMWITTVRTDHGMTLEGLAEALGGGITPERVAAWELGYDLPSSRERMRLTRIFNWEGYVTQAARQWEGWGTALKPATEFWILARKQLENGHLGDNVMAWGTGALPVCAVRTGPDGSLSPDGRWPTNMIMSHGAGCEIVGTRKVTTSVSADRGHSQRAWGASGGATNWGRGREVGRGDAATPSMETIPVWRCDPTCPVKLVESQSDRGGVARYFPALRYEPNDTIDDLIKFSPKTAFTERPIVGSGLYHPTAKSVALMRWLLRLVTPPGGTVLDPFLGSGTTAEAAMLEGLDWIGCEQNDGSCNPCTGQDRPDYVALILARLERYRQGKSPGQLGFQIERPNILGRPDKRTEQVGLF